MNLYGAHFHELVGIINAIASGGEWAPMGGNRWMVEGNIAGVVLRVRHTYHDKGLANVTITGNGWMASFQVTRQRPRSMKEDVRSEMATMILAPYERNAPFDKKLCLHTASMISPDAFQTEMTILRMFETEWS